MTTESSQWKKALIELTSGGTAGFVEVSMLHPLDLVKTRMQLQRGTPDPNDPKSYTGILDCFRKLQKNEGIMSFWKGILPPLITETPTKSVRFSVFHYTRNLFSKGEKPNMLVNMLSGYLAGTAETFVVCPFEVVKVTQQANLAHARVAPSAWSMAKAIYEEDGVFGKRGLYRGLEACMYRHNVYCSVYLGLFYEIRDQIPETESWLRNSLVTLFLGINTSAFACLFNIPFDVVQTRIQANQPKDLKYRNAWQSIRLVVKEEGFLALYKGLSAKLLRLGPGGAIMIFAYEFMHDILTARFL